MHIRSFFIDEFGIFSHTRVEDLSPGLTIFLGRNEAGKSTCLEFLRAMLTGYPDARSREGRRLPQARGGQGGGSLELVTETEGVLRLTRRPGAGNGVLTLADADGHPREPEVLERLMCGISRDVFRSVFGFSLTELQTFASLSADGVRNALYGASFGLGLRSPGEALRRLEQQADEIFKANGKKPRLNEMLPQWEQLRAALVEAEEESAQYDALAGALHDKRERLNAVRARRGELEEHLRRLERRLGVWRQWDEWRKAGAQLERAEKICPAFPEDGPARLARLQEAAEACRRTMAAQQEKISLLRERRDAMEINQPLLKALPALRRLAERKTSYRQAEAAIPLQEALAERARGDLERELQRLGPGWTCERIRATDRSLFAREDMEKQAREMIAAGLMQQSAALALTKANNDVENAERDVVAARETLDGLPEPEALLPDEGRDALRHALGMVEETRQRLPLRRRAVQNAINAFARVYDPLCLAGGEAKTLLDELLARRDDALRLAEEMQKGLHAADEAQQNVQQAENQLEDIKQRIDLLREEQRALEGPSRDALDSRASAIRRLRALSGTLNTERERLAELDQRIAVEQPPAPIKSIPLLAAGILLMLAGGAILLAHWQLGMESLPLTPTLSVPISLWSGYLVLVCGVFALSGGMPRSGPEAKRHKQAMEQLHSRRESAAVHLSELEMQADDLCRQAQAESMDAAALDAAEAALEREREQCFSGERLRKDIEDLRRQQTLARSELSRLQSAAHEAEQAVQHLRRRWHEFMQTFGVGSVPAPEAAEAFFARAEAARVAWHTVDDAQAEVDALEEDVRRIEEVIRAVPPVAERLRDAAPDDPAALQEAGRQVLDNCRDADAVREQRIKAEAALRNRESDRDRLRRQRDEQDARLQEADARLAEARSQWAECLSSLGLGEELAPETVREAFASMENSLAAEAALERAQAEITQSREEIDALRAPLRDILQSTGTSVADDADWLELLDACLDDAVRTDEARRERERLELRITEENDACRAAKAALDEALAGESALFALAEAQDAEDFLRKAAALAEQRDISRRRADLEDTLRLAAGDTPLEAFLDSFNGQTQEEQERDSSATRNELADSVTEEQNLSEEVAALAARVENLGHTGKPADLAQQKALLQESMNRTARIWARASLARAVLLQAKHNFEKERQPQVLRLASSLFESITGGQWSGISASLESRELHILSASGESVDPDILSRGAQEQAYLALRLAYIQNHAAQATPLPIIMDDVLVNFDPERARRAARAFVDLCEGRHGPAHQLIYFTCHPHVAEMLRETQTGSALFTVENGAISRSCTE
ncbi:MAG: AAA family ATPase [Desulfovibrio sp.]|uniref:AAA family ATPase n=1 Tax=Desulfovibrio sp. TaxID=885 RepID=UPI0025B9575E|nr:AAA family ATPase [Desulfovibrio sp.]MCI7567997.1 AAA family ATPase [Desulfovibrio sp.]